MAQQNVGGETPASAPAEKIDTPVTAPVADTSSLQKPAQDFTARVKEANSPNAIRAMLEEAKRAGLKAPPKEGETKPEGNPAADIPPDLKAAAEAEGQTPAETPPETPEETPAETPAEPESDETDEGDAADEETVTPSQAKKLRLRLPEDDKVGRLAAAFMQRNRDMSMEAALDKARSQLGIKAQPEAKPAEQQPKSDLPDTVEAVEAKIKELRAERKKANTELRFEEASDLADKIDDLRQHQFNLAKQAEKQAAEASRSYEQKFNSSAAKAAELYDFASKPDSEGGKRMKEIDEALEETRDPLFSDPEKPLRIAQMVAKEMSIAPRKKGAPAAPAKPTPPATPAPNAPKKGVVPTGGSRTVPPATNQKPAIMVEVEAAKSIKDIREIRKKLGLAI